MKRIITEDGSVTFYSDVYKESYHSRTGAIEEAFKKFVEPCNIAEIARKGDIKILDVCFGIGYNTLAALYTTLKINPRCSIEIVVLEKDRKILKKINSIEVPAYLRSYYIILKLIVNNNFNLNNKKLTILGTRVPSISREFFGIKNCRTNVRGIKPTIFNNKNIKINVLIGDATKIIKKIDRSFDAVFLDPFSPPKNPELWTLEFFKDIKERMNLTARLATYSCASLIRKNLNKAGFKVIDGPCVGRKGPSTIAIKTG